MDSMLVYSFRTNKHLDTFHKAGIPIFVLGSLKLDMLKLNALINKVQPKQIIGIAEIKGASRFERSAANRFGKSGTISKSGVSFYMLYVPSDPIFSKSKVPTKSFCNWAMYKVGEMAETNGIKQSFIHFNKKDLPKLMDFIRNAQKGTSE